MMQLLEIKGLFEMDTGAPSPTILSNDNELYVTFYADQQNLSNVPRARNAVYDTGIVGLKFRNCLKYTFGTPGDETIHGHPYHKLGMQSYSFYELKNSDLIISLQDIDRVHPQYNPKDWDRYRHYILTFHDNMFECVAQNFEMWEEHTSIHKHLKDIVQELSDRYA